MNFRCEIKSMVAFRFIFNQLGIVTLISLFVLVGCAPKVRPFIPELTALQREALQTKELPGDFETVFSATIAVLQDEGWKVDSIEKDSGMIQGSSTKRSAKFGPSGDYYNNHPELEWPPEVGEWTRWEQITAHVEKWGEESVRMRLSIVKVGSQLGNPKPSRVKFYQGLVLQALLISLPTDLVNPAQSGRSSDRIR